MRRALFAAVPCAVLVVICLCVLRCCSLFNAVGGARCSLFVARVWLSGVCCLLFAAVCYLLCGDCCYVLFVVRCSLLLSVVWCRLVVVRWRILLRGVCLLFVVCGCSLRVVCWLLFVVC